MIPIPEKWQFVQYQHKGRVHAARVTEEPTGLSVPLCIFFLDRDTETTESVHKARVPFSPTPRDGHWSLVPDAPKTYYQDAELTTFVPSTQA